MRYLLDTCALLWFADDSPEMSATAYAIVEDPRNQCTVSVISFWELSMKAVVGKLMIPMGPADLEILCSQEGLTVLPLVISHVDRFHQLPTSHRDPFDRLLAAIALDGGYSIMSPDSAFDDLAVPRVW